LIGRPAQLCLASLSAENTVPSGIYLKLAKDRPARSEDQRGRVSANRSAVLTERSIMVSIFNPKVIKYPLEYEKSVGVDQWDAHPHAHAPRR